MNMLSKLLTIIDERTLKIVAFLSFLTMAITGSVFLASSSITLAAGTQMVNLVNTALGITSKTPWHLSRSAGTVAYLLLLGSTVWGLLLSSKIIKEAIPAALSLAMHSILSWLALVFTGLHALVLLLDNYYTYTLSALVIPFIGPYQPVWVGLGILGFYMMALVASSFQFRRQIGQKRWRKLHYLSFAVFILVTVHGIEAGTDSGKASMQLIYLGSGLLVFFLTTYRLLIGNGKQMNQ